MSSERSVWVEKGWFGREKVGLDSRKVWLGTNRSLWAAKGHSGRQKVTLGSKRSLWVTAADTETEAPLPLGCLCSSPTDPESNSSICATSCPSCCSLEAPGCASGTEPAAPRNPKRLLELRHPCQAPIPEREGGFHLLLPSSSPPPRLLVAVDTGNGKHSSGTPLDPPGCVPGCCLSLGKAAWQRFGEAGRAWAALPLLRAGGVREGMPCWQLRGF